MLQITILTAVVALASTAAVSVNKQAAPASVSLEFLTKKEMDVLLQQNPDAKLLEPKVAAENLITKSYTQGYRISADYLVYQSSNFNSWNQPLNAKLNVLYPTYGTGNTLSYIEVIVQQSYDNGRAVILSGGVGYNYVHLIVEAYSTSYFNYNVNLYGY